jgi:hypothetical protein
MTAWVGLAAWGESQEHELAELIKEKPRYGVRLIQNDDGVYRVLVDAEVTFESKVLSAAEIEFDEAVASRSESAREARSREAADFAIRGVMARANQAKAASRNAGRARGKGG